MRLIKEQKNRAIVFLIALLAVSHIAMTIYRNLQTERNDVSISITSPGEHSEVFKIALAGDIHTRESADSLLSLRDLIEEMLAADPDILLFIGDYTESPPAVKDMNKHREQIIDTLKKATSKPSVFVLGNYEALSNADLWYAEMNRHGLNTIENEVRTIATRVGPVCIRGLGDYYSGRYKYVEYPKACDDKLRLSITHDPSGAFDNRMRGVTLAGHTHCGQVRFPVVGIMWAPTEAPRYGICGLHIEQSKVIFVTSGVGTSILPIRYLAQSQWDLIELKF